MNIYNTLTHKIEKFVPNEPGKVSMYTCGPTVYHYAHIGNLRSYIMEDVLEKYLRYDGYDVKRVMNITDVGHLTSDGDTGDDKMLKGAKREHKTVMEIAKFYTDAFFEDCKKLNIKRPDVVEPATGCIGDFIKVISALMDKGYAYEAGGNIYFDTSKLKEYYVFTTLMRKILRSAFVRALRRTQTSATRLTLYCGSQSRSSTIRSLSGIPLGVWATLAGISSVHVSP